MTEETQAPEKEISMVDVAQKMFGDKFVGEVPDKPEEKPEETEGDVLEEEISPEIEDEATEEPGETEAENEHVEEAEAPDEVEISTLSELAEHLELEEGWAKGLKVPVKVNGEESDASIEDLVASYQMREAAEARLEDAKTKAQSVVDEANGRFQKVNDQAKIAAALIERAEDMLDKDTAGINWERLRQDDPAEYSAKKADVAERANNIEQLKSDALSEYEKVVSEQNEKMALQREGLIRAEAAQLLKKIPEWSDGDVAGKEKAELSEYLMGLGFSADDIGKAADHRVIYLAREAMLRSKEKGKVDIAKKKIAKIPKVMKPGSPKPEDQRKTENIERLAAKAKETGNMADALALLKAKRRA